MTTENVVNHPSKRPAMKQIVPISSTLQIQSHLLPWGNGLGVRITKSLACASGMTADSLVMVTAKPGKIIIEAMPKRATLDELLAKFDPVRHGFESMACSPVGKEVL
ncbi:MAG: PbsX family transcriptional regulator [Polynucleobacter sp.]|uniref:AbrB/MazE/SpoVT family DNA-binding domain-containing protein n=1 Tax=Polynucleobacter sp. TaxID=2029855 RepID=UPI002724314D|nr:PbsX family transcriptional regulator [Polynucleobacter sp.]MDO8714466.1 PbsX family transcriptional regulator [Polynucleobacter sp.]